MIFFALVWVRCYGVIGASATSMYCECPRRVIELLRSLSAFERYSAECTLFEEARERVARAGRPCALFDPS